MPNWLIGDLLRKGLNHSDLDRGGKPRRTPRTPPGKFRTVLGNRDQIKFGYRRAIGSANGAMKAGQLAGKHGFLL